MILSSVITKQIDATWDAGDDAGGMNDGEAVGNDTWYHVFLLSTAGGADVDMGFDTDVDATNLLADAAVIAAGLTKYRRLGSVLTDGNGDIILFTQRGDEFLLDAISKDYHNSSMGTNAVLVPIMAPLGIIVDALLVYRIVDSTPSGNVYSVITSPSQTDLAASNVNYTNSTSEFAETSFFSGTIRTDVLSQIRLRSDTSQADIYGTVLTRGWIDSRGKS
jgi:hypothetical protein